MKEKSVSNRIVIVLTEHPVLGMLLVPYTVEPYDDGILQLVEQTFHIPTELLAQMDKTVQMATDIASHYTEKYLMGIYSKEKTIPKFLRKLSEDPDKFKSSIRPFIEKKLLEMVELIRNYDLPLYQKQSGSKLLYAHHAYKIHKHDAEVKFRFVVDQRSFNYQVECFYNGNPLSLTAHKPAMALTSSPAVLLLGMELFVFRRIEANRLLPFTKKAQISVSKALLQKYIENIVIPIARYHETEIEGLWMKQERRTCEPFLYMEETVYNDMLLRLDFHYGDQIFTPQDSDEAKKIIFIEDREGKAFIRYYERDGLTEKRSVRLLEENGLQAVSDSHFKLSENAPERNIPEWIDRHREMLQNSFILTSSQRNTPYSMDEIRIEQSYKDGPDWFELHIIVVIGNLRIPFERFRDNILKEDREYVLPDGRVILLPEEWFSKYANLLDKTVPENGKIQLKHAFVGIIQSILQEEECKKLPLFNPDKLKAAPAGLKAQLRHYQQIGFSWLVHLHKQSAGGCLADDMGLGKTLQTLALLQYIYNNYEEDQSEQSEENLEKQKNNAPKRKAASLIVVPTSLLHNWRREAKRFTTLAMTEYNSTINLPKDHPERFFDCYRLVFTTYGTMRNNIDLLSQYSFEYVVLDESQNIKNSESLTFRAAIQLRSNHRLVLTGTPIENSLKDLWAQFHFLQPELLGDETTFNRQFIAPIRQSNGFMEERLRQLISPFILRRTKSEVAPELPSLTEETIYCNMSETQNEIYQKEKNSLRNSLLKITVDKERPKPLTVLNGILRLRQLSCHPQMIFPDFTGVSGKMEQIINTFETLQSEGHKVLIFSSFVRHLELIATEFERRQWPYALLTGASTNRSAEIARFTENDNIQAFLISLKAGGVGLNLTQADYVFIIDPWWNPAAEAQAISRAHRIGQNKQVIAYRFITQGSIEEKILQLQENKKRLAATFITDDDSLQNILNEEWTHLLE